MRARAYVVTVCLDTGNPYTKPVYLDHYVVAYTAADAVTQARVAFCERNQVPAYMAPGRVLLNPGETGMVTPVVVAVKPARRPA